MTMSNTSQTIFHFDPAMPEVARECIEPVLGPLAWLLPPWCQKCHVFYSDDGRDTNLQNEAAIAANNDYAYRRLSLTFYPCFLTHTPQEQYEMCVHDLLHASTCLLADYAREELERLLPKDEAPKYRAALMEELRQRHEAMTQDLAWVICRKIAKPDPELSGEP